MLNTEVVQVAAGRTQKAGVTRSGRLILWEVSRLVGLELGGVPVRKGGTQAPPTPSPVSPNLPTGSTPRRWRGYPSPRGSGAAAAPVCLTFPRGPVRGDDQARVLWGPLHSLPDR